MQDIDRPAQVQALTEPTRPRCPRVEPETLPVVIGPEGADRIGGHRGRRRRLGQGPPIRPPEPKRVVRPSLDPIALLVHCAVMPAAEQSEVGERGRASLRPVLEVMALGDAAAAARETAAPVAVTERPPQGGRNGPRASPDLEQCPVLVMPHHHPTGIASQAAGRFRGNASAVLQDRLAGLIRVGQSGGIDVNHHLVTSAAICSGVSTTEGRWFSMARSPSLGATLHPAFKGAGDGRGRARPGRGMKTRQFSPGRPTAGRCRALGGHSPSAAKA